MHGQGRRWQGKLLEGAKISWGVQGAEHLGEGQGAKPSEADAFLVFNS